MLTFYTVYIYYLSVIKYIFYQKGSRLRSLSRVKRENKTVDTRLMQCPRQKKKSKKFHLSNNEPRIKRSFDASSCRALRFELPRNNELPLLPLAPEATCEGNSRRRSHPKRITLGRGGQSLSSTMRR